jgi:hypothetical protein
LNYGFNIITIFFIKIKIETTITIYNIITHSTTITIITTIKMASTSSLFIGYARTTCTKEQVKHVFNSAFQENIVSNVDERIKKDTNGYDYKMFFVHFSHTNDELDLMMARTVKEGFVPIIYATEYDKKLGERVERYWKVLPFAPKPTGIRIMSEEEAARLARPKRIESLELPSKAAELEEGEVSP